MVHPATDGRLTVDSVDSIDSLEVKSNIENWKWIGRSGAHHYYPITPKTKLDSNINATPIMISFGSESKAEWETAIGLNGYCLNQKKSGAATEFQHA